MIILRASNLRHSPVPVLSPTFIEPRRGVRTSFRDFKRFSRDWREKKSIDFGPGWSNERLKSRDFRYFKAEVANWRLLSPLCQRYPLHCTDLPTPSKVSRPQYIIQLCLHTNCFFFFFTVAVEIKGRQGRQVCMSRETEWKLIFMVAKLVQQFYDFRIFRTLF